VRLPVLALVASLIIAVPASAEPSSEALSLSRRYVDAIHLEAQLVAVMRNMMPAVLERAAAQAGGRSTPELNEAVAHASAETMRAIAPKMIELMAPVVADSFTVEELRAAVAYYESPLAQSLLEKMPAFTAKMMPAFEPLMPEMEEELSNRVCEEIGCDPRALKR
jgi:hypothetical protein